MTPPRPRRRAGRDRTSAAVMATTLMLLVVLVAGVALTRRPWRGDPPALVAPRAGVVPSSNPTRAVVWAVGDGADGSERARRVAARIGAGRVDRFLYLGDVYGPILSRVLNGDGTGADYRTRYHAVYGALASRTAPTPGNHEWAQRGDGYEPYWRRHLGRRPSAWYAFAAGGWQLLSLNSEAPHGAGSAQVRWLRAQLRGPGTCRLAFWHRPRFSSGKHGDQLDVAPLWDALRGRATLVVGAHDHAMQRFRPVDGLVQVVSGAGGRSLYALRPDARRAFGADDVDGALRIVLEPGRAELTFVAVDGRVLDRSRVRCRPA